MIKSFIDNTSEGWLTLPQERSVICSKPSIPPKSTKTPKSVTFFTLPSNIDPTSSSLKSALFKELEVGSILEGRVKNVTDFGVFVDLGGIDGLLHITDLSWGRVNHPSEVLSMNDLITVKVIEYDEDRKRVSLGP